MIAHVLVFFGLALAGPDRPATPPAPAVATEPAPAAPEGPLDAKSAAQAALVLGNKRLKDGDVAGAIEEYRRAQTIYPPSAAKLEFNIAKAEETRGDEPAAAAAYERFLSQSLEIPPEYREEARNELHRLAAALGSLRLDEKRPGYAVVVDGQVQGRTPLPGDVWVRPGHHVLTLEEDDHVMFRDDVDVNSGATVEITVTIHHPRADGAPKVVTTTLPPPATPAPLVAASGDASGPRAHDDDHSLLSRWWFWAAAAAVVAGGTTAILLSTRSDCPVATCKSVTVQGP